MRPRTIALLVTVGVFLGGLALVWATGSKQRVTPSVAAVERTFTFPLNASGRNATVRSRWKLGHMTPQDDQVELTLEGSCVTAHLYAYLSTGWDNGPLRTASLILGTPLHPVMGVTPPSVVRSTANSAILLSRESQRGVLVQRDAPRDYDTLLVNWQAKNGCRTAVRSRESRELGRLFLTFKVLAPPLPARRMRPA